MDLSKARKGDRVTIVLDEYDALALRSTLNLNIKAKNIIVIEPAAFNWDDVKHGHAFIKNGNLCYFIGFSIGGKEWAIIQFENRTIDSVSITTLTRAPEHDKT